MHYNALHNANQQSCGTSRANKHSTTNSTPVDHHNTNFCGSVCQSMAQNFTQNTRSNQRYTLDLFFLISKTLHEHWTTVHDEQHQCKGVLFTQTNASTNRQMISERRQQHESDYNIMHVYLRRTYLYSMKQNQASTPKGEHKIM